MCWERSRIDHKHLNERRTCRSGLVREEALHPQHMLQMHLSLRGQAKRHPASSYSEEVR